MKKTNLLKLLIIVFTISFMSSCKEEHKCNHESKSINPEDIEGYFTHPALESRPSVALDYDQVVSMLKEYDATRIEPLEKALGYPDSRINTYDFNQFIQYLNYVKKLSKKVGPKGINITGISFISAAMPNYEGLKKSYQDLIYIPTTTINGKQIPFDAVLSAERDSLVTFKAALAENGYNWIYNTKKEFEEGKNEKNDYSISKLKENKAGVVSLVFKERSGAGNLGQLEPPY